MQKQTFILISTLLLYACHGDRAQKTTLTNEREKLITKADTIVLSPENKNKDTAAGMLFDVKGTYVLEEDQSSCKIVLNIDAVNKQYKYKLETNTRNLQGAIDFKLNEKGDGYYVALKNIEWSEYEGAIKFGENGEQIDNGLALPQDIEGILFKNELSIQNSGNAMNYYVVLGECDLKYIHLVKRKGS